MRQHELNHRHRDGFAHLRIALQQADFKPALHQQYFFNQTVEHQPFIGFGRGFGLIGQQCLIGAGIFGAVNMPVIDAGNGSGLGKLIAIAHITATQRDQQTQQSRSQQQPAGQLFFVNIL